MVKFARMCRGSIAGRTEDRAELSLMRRVASRRCCEREMMLRVKEWSTACAADASARTCVRRDLQRIDAKLPESRPRRSCRNRYTRRRTRRGDQVRLVEVAKASQMCARFASTASEIERGWTTADVGGVSMTAWMDGWISQGTNTVQLGGWMAETAIAMMQAGDDGH